MTPQHTKVVIIGGGILGVSVLFHLCRSGWTDTLLLEKSDIASGSTWLSAGNVALSLNSPLHMWFAKYAVELFEELEDQSAIYGTGWQQVGSVRPAVTREEEAAFESYLRVAASFGIPMDVITPPEFKAAYPLYENSALRSGLRTYTDGYVDPPSLTNRLAEDARLQGGTIRTQSRVEGVARTQSGEWRLKVRDHCDVICEHIVFAGGSYTNQLCDWIDAVVPVFTFLHHNFLTEDSDAVSHRDKLPVFRDERSGGYIRQMGRGLLIGTSESRNVAPIWRGGVSWETEYASFEADYDQVGGLLAGAVGNFPLLRRLGVRKSLRGAVPYTPDGEMFLGRVSPFRSAWVAAGAASGVASAAGIGKCLSEMMIRGRAPINLEACNPNRFSGQDLNMLAAAATDTFMRRGKNKTAPPTSGLPTRRCRSQFGVEYTSHCGA